MDADSQNEGVAANISGPETESDSDNGEVEDVIEDDLTSETPYILTEEEEFGSVGLSYLSKMIIVKKSCFRLENKLKNCQRNTRA